MLVFYTLVGLGLSQFAKYLVNEIKTSSEFSEVPEVSEVPGVQNVQKVHKVKEVKDLR